jgi:hypothetical protein
LSRKRNSTQNIETLTIWRHETLTQIDNADHESRKASTGRMRDAARAG